MRLQLVSFSLLLTLAGVSSVASAALLSVDFNDRTGGAGSTPSNTQSGFSGWKMSGTTAASSALETQPIGSYTVTLQAFDDHQDENTVTAGVQDTTGQIDDRLRTTPTNGGLLTAADLYDDVIFAGTSVGPTGGTDLKVSGGSLLPNTKYVIGLYAFDSGSTPAPQPRTANWLDGNNGDALVLATSFSGAALPTFDDQYKFIGLAMTDATGTLFLKGRNTTPNATTGPTSIGVFINGLEINEVPEPASLALFLLAVAMIQLRRHHH
jgi:hypothetical protein